MFEPWQNGMQSSQRKKSASVGLLPVTGGCLSILSVEEGLWLLGLYMQFGVICLAQTPQINTPCWLLRDLNDTWTFKPSYDGFFVPVG